MLKARLILIDVLRKVTRFITSADWESCWMMRDGVVFVDLANAAIRLEIRDVSIRGSWEAMFTRFMPWMDV